MHDEEDDPEAELPKRTLGPIRRRTYEPNVRKHGVEQRGRIAREPRDGQEALDFSIGVKPTSSVRVGIDYEEKSFVVLRRHLPGEIQGRPNDELFHGYVVDWGGLTQPMKNALILSGMTDRRGRIL